MCGIAGIIRFDDTPVRRSEIETILNKIAHRGIDACHIELGSKHNGGTVTRSAEIGFGHRRLSILDLNQSGAQPMFYADKKLCITYNGEIYNYQELKSWLQKKSYTFNTNTDTEVLLAAYDYWGKECVKFLNGMFAFALWDDKNKILFCARDPIGIKPFYYKKTAEYLAFASESLSLAHLSSKTLDEGAVTSYLLSMYVATNHSIFSGIEKLAPGHTLTVNGNRTFNIKRFWSVDQFEILPKSDANLEKLKEVIQRSISQQLMSDVPVGGFLSGGVDSGLITAIAAPQIKKYHTYSVGYEGMANSELAHAKHIANRYGTIHTETTITAANAMSLLDQALNCLSEPVADPAIVATNLLSELAAKDGVKVLLNGTGGDEIFAGYTRYSGQLSLKRKLLARLPVLLKHILADVAANEKTKARLQYTSLDMMLSTGGSYTLAARFRENSPQFMAFLRQLGSGFNNFTQQQLPLLYQQMLFDLQVYLPDQLLFLLDQVTMAHTIEGRVPLLDINIIKFAYSFFAKHHMQKGQTKSILKKIAEPYLGSEHINRQKQGFAGSSYWWVKHNYQQFMDVIAELKSVPYFDKFSVDPYCKIKNITEAQTNEIFILYCFTKWYEKVKSVLAL